MTDSPDLSLDPIMRIFEARMHRGTGAGSWISLGAGIGVAGAVTPISSASLFESAQRHASRGLRARAGSEHDDASLQLGIMLEHLAKAYLASLHPTLVMDSKFDFSSLLRLAGQGQRVKPGHVLKTVGMWEALVRIGTIQATGNDGAGKTFANRFTLVFQARNGVAHIGDDGGLADEVAQLAVQGADEILVLMGRSLSELFGDFTSVAEGLRDQHGTKVQQRVALLVARAKQVFKERYGDLPAEQRATELAATDKVAAVGIEDEHDRAATPCPACERVGILSGSADLDWNAEETVTEEGHSFFTIGHPRAVLFPTAFRCPSCGLRLQGGEELAAVALDANLELGPAQLESLEAHYAHLDTQLDVPPDADQPDL
ncbi:hypothetical protein [Modestobacter marinus]|uniref:Uncharacterized protein n=2 Tax=Modestobacter marinus TaxID=477641 RepID=A0A846LW21_9ACTN|nr:hypothetical protein [Modestobacter marinus]NIH69925.1 hypothetical protein [Modestobacter marinus]